MRLTLFVGSEHRPSESMVQRLAEHSEQARLARRLGFDGITIGNHFSYSATAWFPPFETLMRLAADAEGVSLGTCMLILPLYEPLHVAEQCVLLDAASGGHAILGVAPGWAKDEFDVMRLDHGRRTSRFEGKHFQTSRLTLALRPTRKPRPPMWLGGSVATAVRRVAVTRLQWVGMEHRHVMRTIELIGGKIAPLVRKAMQ